MLNNKSELTNWAQNTKQKNTNWHQNLSQKSSKNPIFVVREWDPQEVVLFLTLEVVPKLTLERLKSGTETNSPAYIYIIYIYIYATHSYHDAAPICITILLPKHKSEGLWEHAKVSATVGSDDQGALKGTNLRTNRAQTQIFEDSRRFSLIFAFSWKTTHLGNADFRRKPQISAGNRRKLQEPAENRRLAFVPLGSSPYARP